MGKLVVQTWLEPSQDVPTEWQEPESDLARLRVVHWKNGALAVNSLLLEFDASCDDINQDWQEDQRRVSMFVNRLRYLYNPHLHVVSCRLIEWGKLPGDRVNFRIVNSPHIDGTIGQSVLSGGRVAGYLDRKILSDGMDNKIDRAIRWYLAANQSKHAAEAVLYLWISIESLVPPMKMPWKCVECKSERTHCEHCGAPTDNYAVMRSIRQFLLQNNLCSKKEIENLYSLRSRLVHGTVGLDNQSVAACMRNVDRMRSLAHAAIKQCMNIQGEYPRIEEHPFGLTPSIDMTCYVECDNETYSQPSLIYSKNE